MPTIKSDLTNKTIPAQPMRSFSIPDESAPQQQSYESSLPPNAPIDWDVMDNLMKSRGMPPLDRAALNSQYNQQQAAKRGLLPDIEQQVKEARIEKATGKSRLSPAAKQRIEMLCNISRMKREVELDNQKYVLQNLKGKEQQEIWVSAATFEGTVDFPFELRKQTLARALVQVGGTDIEFFLGTSDLEARLELIEELPEEILNKLYQEFNILIDENKKKFAIKTDQEAAMLVEDLKK